MNVLGQVIFFNIKDINVEVVEQLGRTIFCVGYYPRQDDLSVDLTVWHPIRELTSLPWGRY